MPFYRVEYLIDNLKKYNEEEEKRHKEAEKQQKTERIDMKKYQNQFKTSVPKMPKYKL